MTEPGGVGTPGTARRRILTRLQAIASKDPDYKVGVAAGVWLDDFDDLEAEATRAALLDLMTNVEYLCDEHGQNSILLDDLRAVVYEAIKRSSQSDEAERLWDEMWTETP